MLGTVGCVSNGRSRLRQWTQVITTEQDYNRTHGSHVTKRGYTEVLAKTYQIQSKSYN